MSAIKEKNYRTFTVIKICLYILLFAVSNCFAGEGEFQINCPYWYIDIDQAGYVDYTWYYQSPRHQVESAHEMMTGDWAAAVWYQGIKQGSNQAQWLTDGFVYPFFDTNSPFAFGSYGVSNDSCNPVWTDPCQPNPPPYNPGTKSDSGWSDVNDGNLYIKIYYEVVDLGQQDANGVGGSPMSFRDSSNNPVYVYSERYVLLQTYVFKNVSTLDINGLEFYQMLHGHPAGIWVGAKKCMYETADFYDPLADYIPCDSNHHTGDNFRYDITLWNPGDPQTQHVDWMGFSSTIEPNGVDCGVFEGHYGGEPTTGTHIRIENRTLNGQIYLEDDEVAGAAKWNIGNLEPNETKSITLALMYGVGPIQTTPPLPPWWPPGCEVTLTKDDNIGEGNCVNPSSEVLESDINYTICYSTGCEINDVNIIDYLPEYADFNSCTVGGVYDSNFHVVKWNLGHRDANDSNCFTLKVRVAEDANQGSTLTNKVEMYTGDILIKTAPPEQTLVCCMDNKVYVDACAPPGGNGQSWQTAYKELRDALANVNTCTDQIWVAKGTYKPANDVNYSATFAMIDGIDTYGHFEGWEDNINQRNLADANNDTILTGDIDDNNTSDADYVVTAADSRIDGFTVRKSTQRGISCSACSPIIANCIVKNNNYFGIFCTSDSNVTVTNTFVNDNGDAGIFCYSAGTVNIDRCTVGPNNVTYGLYASSCTVNATDSVFSGNNDWGIMAASSNVTVERCDISDNKYGGGIDCTGSNTHAHIRRCTIQRNTGYGLLSDNSSEVNAVLNIISNNTSAGVYIPDSSNCRLISNLIYRNGHYGISVDRPAEIRNNTIVYNTTNAYGISGGSSGLDSNINSNIIYYNTTGSFSGTFTKVNYNCIQGSFSGGIGNIIDQYPQFRNIDANDYHLLNNSPCIDKGDPNFSSSTEKDIDGEDRIIDGDSNGNSRVDMGADEFCPFDLSPDGFVNFLDFAVLARSWATSQGEPNYNDRCDFYNDSKIDYKDLYIFCEHWLWPTDWEGIGGEGAYFAEGFSGGEEQQFQMEEIPADSDQMAESQESQSESQESQSESQEVEQESMMPDYNLPAVYLTCDTNTPEPNEEVTIWVHSDVPLFAMYMGIYVIGDANITTAMCEADCNEYGWENGWNNNPYFEGNWVYINGVKWAADANGTVGYFKFCYHSGQVSVYIDQESSVAFGWDGESCPCVPLSQEALTFGTYDPNEP
jgi:parallel beta-helix repeat protein